VDPNPDPPRSNSIVLTSSCSTRTVRVCDPRCSSNSITPLRTAISWPVIRVPLRSTRVSARAVAAAATTNSATTAIRERRRI
jgi:hypothetical protein